MGRTRQQALRQIGHLLGVCRQQCEARVQKRPLVARGFRGRTPLLERTLDPAAIRRHILHDRRCIDRLRVEQVLDKRLSADAT